MEPTQADSPTRFVGQYGATEDPLRKAVTEAGIAPEARILVAVSGGPDSVALLDALCRACAGERPKWTLRVAHINHGLRGAESDEDERFVRDFASVRGLAIDVGRIDMAAHDGGTKRSPEEAARELRYAALRGILDRWQGDVIATGHTANDQAETLMMRLLRGTGLTGLAGIRPNGPELARPFLSITRDVILRDLSERGQAYRIDSSNLDLRHRRNLIRHTVTPVLLQVQPAAIRTLSRVARVLRTDAEYLESEVARASRLVLLAHTESNQAGAKVNDAVAGPTRRSRGYVASRPMWMSLHPALRVGILREMSARALGTAAHRTDEKSRSVNTRLELDTRALDRMAAVIETGERMRVQATPIAGGLVLEVGSHTFSIGLGCAEPQRPAEPVTLALPQLHHALARTEPSATSIGAEAAGDPPCAEMSSAHGTLSIFRDDLAPDDRARAVQVSGPMHAWVDAALVGERLVLRSRRAGDRMRPLGMGGSRKLHDLLIDRHVPRSARDLVPVVENGAQIVWVPGVALDGSAAIDSETRTVVHLVFQPHTKRPAW
jgi:tRNA(Ile)-lysidine synthase